MNETNDRMSREATDQRIEEISTDNRVTIETLEAQIARTSYHTHERLDGGKLTICILDLRNGFTVTGEAAAVDPANYDVGIGQSIARRHAVERIWVLEGYALAERNYHGQCRN